MYIFIWVCVYMYLCKILITDILLAIRVCVCRVLDYA